MIYSARESYIFLHLSIRDDQRGVITTALKLHLTCLDI